MRRERRGSFAAVCFAVVAVLAVGCQAGIDFNVRNGTDEPLRVHYSGEHGRDDVVLPPGASLTEYADDEEDRFERRSIGGVTAHRTDGSLFFQGEVNLITFRDDGCTIDIASPMLEGDADCGISLPRRIASSAYMRWRAVQLPVIGTIAALAAVLTVLGMVQRDPTRYEGHNLFWLLFGLGVAGLSWTFIFEQSTVAWAGGRSPLLILSFGLSVLGGCATFLLMLRPVRSLATAVLAIGVLQIVSGVAGIAALGPLPPLSDPLTLLTVLIFEAVFVFFAGGWMSLSGVCIFVAGISARGVRTRSGERQPDTATT